MITDAGFGSFELMKEIQSQGGSWTTSISVNQNTSLWNLLGRNLPPNYWRACIDPNHIVASCHVISDTNGKYVKQQVISSAFKAETSSFFENLTVVAPNNEGKSTFFVLISIGNIPFMTKETLDAMKLEELRQICIKYNIKQGIF